MITVQVFYEKTGKPAKGQRVAIGKSEIWNMSVTREHRTDDNGEAHIDTEPTSNGQVFLNGSTVRRGRIEGRMVFYI